MSQNLIYQTGVTEKHRKTHKIQTCMDGMDSNVLRTRSLEYSTANLRHTDMGHDSVDTPCATGNRSSATDFARLIGSNVLSILLAHLFCDAVLETDEGFGLMDSFAELDNVFMFPSLRPALPEWIISGKLAERVLEVAPLNASQSGEFTMGMMPHASESCILGHSHEGFHMETMVSSCCLDPNGYRHPGILSTFWQSSLSLMEIWQVVEFSAFHPQRHEAADDPMEKLA
jgi:hypothetical protein